jgi:hypothetical protein
MSFWSKLFGPKESPKVGPEPPQSAPLNGGLELPKELGPDTGTVHLNAVFAEHTRDDLLAMCRAMPIEWLDFCRPGSSDLMNRTVSVSLLMVRYLAAKDKPQEYGDVLIPRFTAQLERYDPETIHPQLAVQLEQLGGELAAGGRKNDALRCFLFLSKTLFGRAVAPRVSEYILAMRCNIALESKTREDVDAAVQLFSSLAPSQREQSSLAIAKLKSLRQHGGHE